MKKQRKQNKKEEAKKPLNKWFYLGGILLLTFIVYASSLNNGFIYQFDDDRYITNNPDIKALTTDNIQKLFTKSYVGLYLPLTMTTFMVEYSLFGLNPMPYHATNLILHLACIVLVFFLIYRLKPNVYIASVVAFVFALHPMHVESVTWLSERKDVMYAIFYLAGLITYLKYLENKSVKIYLLTLLFFSLSLMSKMVAVSFPLLIVAFDWYKGRRLLGKDVILEKIPFFALSLFFGLSWIYIIGTANDTSTPFVELVHRPFIVSNALIFYLYKFIAPFNLMIYYYYPDTSTGTLPVIFYIQTAVLISTIAGFTWWVLRAKKIRNELLLGLAFFIIPTFFILMFIPAGRAYVAERYTYLSYIGLAYIFGIVTTDIIHNKAKNNIPLRATLIGVIAFFIIGFSFLTWDRNKDWKDSFTLFNDLIEKNPNHGHPYLIRGITHLQFGKQKEALADYNKSIELDPENAKALSNRSSVKGMLGDYDGAFADANRALEIWPDYENGLNNRATAYFFKEDYQNALADYNKLIELDSSKAELYRKRLNVFEKTSQTQEILNDYLTLTRLEPGNYFNFAKAGDLYYQLDENQKAIDFLSQAIQMKRSYYQVLFFRGNAYYKLNEFQKALNDFSRFAEITGEANAFYNMGMCNKMLDQTAEACAAWQKALDLGHKNAALRIEENCR